MLLVIFPKKMVTVRNEQKLAALNMENHEEYSGATLHVTQLFLEHKRIVSRKPQKKLRVES